MHKPVLLQEIINGFCLSKDDKDDRDNKEKKEKTEIIVDATFGGGGHSIGFLKKHPGLKIIALDQDENTWQIFKRNFPEYIKNISFHAKNFRFLTDVLKKENINNNVSLVIFDLGMSSDQLESSGRGFSFNRCEPLLMTFKKNPDKEDLTAMDIVNKWSEKSLEIIIRGYGEEKFARKIAKAIVASRSTSPIRTTFDLLAIINNVFPTWYKKKNKIHWATKTFQAIRIAVNDELNALKEGLKEGFNSLKPRGRLEVISFNSLEDRIVKNFYKEQVKNSKAKIINKKPIIASEIELKNNIRSRSAKLRILEKL